MIKRNVGWGIAVGIAAGLVGGCATNVTVKEAAQPEGMEVPVIMQLSPEHALLKDMEGSWQGTFRFLMGPGQWVEGVGSCKRKLAYNDRFLIEEIRGDFAGQPFEGMGITGFNSATKEFETVWIENMATNISLSTGTYDASKKSYSFLGEMIDPMTGETFKCRSVMDASNPRKHTMQGFRVGADGHEELMMEGTMSKK